VDAATAMDEIGLSTSNLTGGIISWAEANKEVIC
jgi:rhodanese-related sulfurtransferase